MATLKEREQRILSYMKEEIKTKGYPPTVREICGALGIKSTSTAHKDIESLVKQGYLVKDPSKPRALMVVDPVSGKHGESQPSAYDDSARAHSGIVNIPVVGSVAAGTPILAEQNIEDFFPFLPSTLPEG
jgi:LexA DNA binding domain